LEDFLQEDRAPLGLPGREMVRYVLVSPQGGVWVLGADEDDSASRRTAGEVHQHPEFVKKTRRQVETFRGSFHANPIDCPLFGL